MEAELPDVSCVPALLVKADRREQLCNFFPEMENAFLRHGGWRHGVSRKL
jgi:hypothetical protein